MKFIVNFYTEEFEIDSTNDFNMFFAIVTSKLNIEVDSSDDLELHYMNSKDEKTIIKDCDSFNTAFKYFINRKNFKGDQNIPVIYITLANKISENRNQESHISIKSNDFNENNNQGWNNFIYNKINQVNGVDPKFIGDMMELDEFLRLNENIVKSLKIEENINRKKSDIDIINGEKDYHEERCKIYSFDNEIPNSHEDMILLEKSDKEKKENCNFFLCEKSIASEETGKISDPNKHINTLEESTITNFKNNKIENIMNQEKLAMENIMIRQNGEFFEGEKYISSLSSSEKEKRRNLIEQTLNYLLIIGKRFYLN